MSRHGLRGGAIGLEALLQDARFGVWMLARHRSFAFLAGLTLAAGIGVSNDRSQRALRGASPANVLDFQDQAGSFDALAAVAYQEFTAHATTSRNE
jgi:hypothetical protein